MTVDKQPRALYLADVLAAGFECDQEWYEIESAKELRRLYAENEALKEKLLNATKSALDHKERGDVLLEGLKWVVQISDEGGYPDGKCLQEARAAIAKATGGAA